MSMAERQAWGAGNADVLREEVMASAWYEAFRSDMRSSAIVRAVESSLGRMSTATTAATSWTSSRLASASQSFKSVATAAHNAHACRRALQCCQFFREQAIDGNRSDIQHTQHGQFCGIALAGGDQHADAGLELISDLSA